MKIRIEEFYEFMKERERIRLKKESGEPFPWTDDKIFQEFRFTNVHRHNDRTSKEFERFYEEYHDRSKNEILLNCAIARYFGKPETIRAIGWVDHLNEKSLREIKENLIFLRNSGVKLFTSAYLIPSFGAKGSEKHDLILDQVMLKFQQKIPEFIQIIEETNKWEPLIKEMKKVFGFGGHGFMAKEAVLDTFYFPGFWRETKIPNHFKWLPTDLNEWVPIGPGALRGAKRLIGLKPVDYLKESHALEILKEVFSMRNQFWPEEFDPIDLHVIQFQACEFDKYERIKEGGRGKRRFKQNVEQQA